MSDRDSEERCLHYCFCDGIELPDGCTSWLDGNECVTNPLERLASLRTEIKRRTEALVIWDILASYADAGYVPLDFPEWWAKGEGSEYRFGGSLGFGGKLWRNPTRVNFYLEEFTPERKAVMEKVNDILASLTPTEEGT